MLQALRRLVYCCGYKCCALHWAVQPACQMSRCRWQVAASGQQMLCYDQVRALSYQVATLIRAQGYLPVSNVGASTGLDCGENCWRRKIDTLTSEKIEMNLLCQF